MRTKLFDRQEIFTAAATLAAHGVKFFRGFRQYDLRFMAEIFTNWMAPLSDQPVLHLQNNQVARYLRDLVEHGFARENKRGKRPIYTLSSTLLWRL